MAKFILPAVITALSSITTSSAFTPNHIIANTNYDAAKKVSSTELYIIGPMIRKMREENAQKKMPMASAEEKVGEAPGLRVGADAWKWPPVWPYDGDAFTPKKDIKAAPQASPMSAMLGQMPVVPDVEDEKDKFDVMKYWQEEKATVTTDVDAAAVEALQK